MMPRRHVPWALRIGVVALGLLPLAWSVPAGANTPGNRAGYSAVQTGSSASAQTTFNVPTLTCPNNDFQAIGLRAVIRTTEPQNNGAFIFLECFNGTPSYAIQFQVNGNITRPTTFPVVPGDRVQSSVSVTPTATNESVIDVTQGWTQTANGAGATPALASVGAGGVGCTNGAPPCLPVPDFGNVTFGKSAIDGTSLPNAGAYPTDLTTTAGVVEATAGKLTQGGTGFKVTWVSSCSSDPSSTEPC